MMEQILALLIDHRKSVISITSHQRSQQVWTIDSGGMKTAALITVFNGNNYSKIAIMSTDQCCCCSISYESFVIVGGNSFISVFSTCPPQLVTNIQIPAFSMVLVSSTQIWVGSSGCVYIIDPTNWTITSVLDPATKLFTPWDSSNIPDTNRLQGDLVLALYYDESFQTVWIGFSTGKILVYHLESRKIKFDNTLNQRDMRASQRIQIIQRIKSSILISSLDGYLHVVCPRTFRTLEKRRYDTPILSLLLLSEDDLIVCFNRSDTFSVWNPDSLKEIDRIVTYHSSLYSSASFWSAKNCCWELWVGSFEDGVSVWTVPELSSPPSSIASAKT